MSSFANTMASGRPAPGAVQAVAVPPGAVLPARLRAPDQGTRGGDAGLFAEVALDDRAGDAEVPDGSEEALAPVDAGLVVERPGDVDEVPSAVDLDEVAGQGLADRDVVDADRHRVGQVREVPDEDDGQAARDEALDVPVVDRGARDDRAVRGPGAHDPLVRGDAVGLLRVRRDDELAVVGVGGACDPGEDVHEVQVAEHVLGRVRHDERDRPGALAAERPAGGARDVAEIGGGALHGGPGALADPLVTGERHRGRRARHADTGGDVLERDALGHGSSVAGVVLYRLTGWFEIECSRA
jgi:hypothetical protein